ncbi:alkaline phosphatase D family protein [Qipengyuania sp. JC766]|uniref:alkaline phosphatase D family protein n=1 Tax=Qipengyuania sp. JC766 TaxID=3232139 RepID=UPI0034576621
MSFPTEPPALAISRRDIFRLGGASAALVATAPLAAQTRTGFTHGVASGEPGQDRVLLWTRFVGSQDTPLDWEVRTNDAERRLVAEGSVVASPDNDWCAKAQVTGLEPDRWYFYRFTAPNGEQSAEGRTRTLPAGETAAFRMAAFSCSNLGFGWFNAYRHAAETGDFDLALHLGDYFYEYAPGTYPDDERRLPERTVYPETETVALADYRLRHAAYRDDPDLQRLHQIVPWIMGWDDHESANDSWTGGAENHQPDSEGEWSARKRAAMRAYREWLPVSDNPWEAYDIGDLATLFRLETRLEARSEQFSLSTILEGNATPEEAAAALTSFRDGDYRDPARTVLGSAQEAWLASGLSRSRSEGKTWQVLVQQVLMGKVASPERLLEPLTQAAPEAVRPRLLAAILASKAGLPLNMDAWDGYPAARDRLLDAVLAADANLISLAGDTHNAWAFDLTHRGEAAGIEFAVQGVTSPGLETYLDPLPPETLARALVQRNPELQWMDASQRGYMVVELTASSASCEWRFAGTIRQRTSRLAGTSRLSAEAGRNALTV